MCTKSQAGLLLQWIFTDFGLIVYYLEDIEQSYTFLLKATKVLASKLSTLGAQKLSIEEKKSAVCSTSCLFCPNISNSKWAKYEQIHFSLGTSEVKQLGESYLSLRIVIAHKNHL